MQLTMIKKICCIGAGYVGGPTMAVIADRCPHIDVTVVDLNEERISLWNSDDLNLLPVYEPGLSDIVERCRGRNLFFSTEVDISIQEADMVFLSVNTPTKIRGLGAGQASDLRWIEASARQVARCAQGHTIVVEKSTLPVRTADTVKTILQSSLTGKENDNDSKSFAVLSNPEFLAEGTAIRDLEAPDRVLIGGEDQQAIELLATIYQNWVSPSKIITTNLWSSELSKLTANAFLAQRITSINSIASLCEKTGANVTEVAHAIGTDSRIGHKFLKSGPGFGGSCFQKDILNLVYLCRHYGLNDIASYWQSVVDLNYWQQNHISRTITEHLFGTLTGKKIAVFGFAFKADTNDTRESPAIKICLNLLEEGACLAIYDPKVSSSQIQADLTIGPISNSAHLNNSISTLSTWTYFTNSLEAVQNADAVLILTEWDEFKYIDWAKIAASMRQPSWLFDTRLIADLPSATAAGMNVWRVGSSPS